MIDRKNILLCGDSFAADWSIQCSDYPGWPTLLKNYHNVTNVAQAGVSEYKIWLQLSTIDLTAFDLIIIFHTSPYRIPVEKHPLHNDSILHQACDLIYSDIKNRNDPELTPIIDFFEKYFSLDYAKFVYQLLISHEITYLKNNFPGKILHCHGLDWCDSVPKEFVSFQKIYESWPGSVNHFDSKGNRAVLDIIVKFIDDLYRQW